MVYESDFYTVRRPYSTRITPSVTSYSYTTPSSRVYSVLDTPSAPRRAEQNYSYSYSSTSESSNRSTDPYRPTSRNYSTSERVSRSTGGSGPGSTYSSEYSVSRGDGPGGYHSSYSSTASGRLPHGTTYRHYSYRV